MEVWPDQAVASVMNGCTGEELQLADRRPMGHRQRPPETTRSGTVVFRSVTKPNMRSHAMKRSASALGAY